MISEKIIPTTLERNKKEKRDYGLPTTLERENEKNIKMANKRHSDIPSSLNKPERNKTRYSEGHTIQPENGVAHIEHAEVQKRENDPKKGMKFGIRVLPPNIPDDGVLKQKNVENGSVTVDKKPIDEPDKPQVTVTTQIKHESETEVKKPVVAKRREKMAPPVPNARTKVNEVDAKTTQVKTPDVPVSFSRTDLNSSGIKRDENGIPQELPQHMFDAAKAAINNRKSSSELIYEKEVSDAKKEDALKPSKKSKGKAPSPPEVEKNKTDDSILEQLRNVHDFLINEKQHSSLLHDSSIVSMDISSSYNSSTPKSVKTKGISKMEESINFSQDDIDDIVSKPFKRESDSLNNFYADSKSNLSSNQDVYSVVSLNHSDKSDKGSTTIELNNSDITIHSSPNDTVQSVSDDASLLDENERKAASLGDLSRFELRARATKPSSGTLERAQSLDISADDAEITDNQLGAKKRKAKSVVETTFFENSGEDVLPDMIDSETGIVIKHKEPRLSLNIAKTSAMEGLNTFQRNRLKKGSEFGNLEDAIVKGSSSSIDSDKMETQEFHTKKEHDLPKLDEPHETSDHLARRIMDENIKVHLKLVSEFAKSTSDGSNMSSLDSSREVQTPSPTKGDPPPKYDEKLTVSYDTNIPDDMKVSRNTYANSLERPKSEMMKKLLAKNPILNVHIDKPEASTTKETPTPMTDASKSAVHQPDIVNFDLKADEKIKPKDYDDFVSNIRVGSNNNSLKYNRTPDASYTAEWKETKPKDVVSSNVVTITTNQKSQPSDQKYGKSYTKSIEIGEPTRRLIPDVIEGIKRRAEEREGRTVYMEPSNIALTTTQEPVQKTVTVNVAEDEFGNKVITQNVEKISAKYMGKSEAPLQVEQVSFGIMKNPEEISQLDLEEGNVKDFDKKLLDQIKRQNPHMHFTSDEPSYTKTETILLNTELNEDQAVALMEKIKNDPSFMAQKTPEELSQLGIRIIRDLEDIKHETHDTIEVSQTKYSINPSALSDAQKHYEIQSLKDKHDEKNKDHVTEIQVVTPRTEKMLQQKTEGKDKISSRQRAPVETPTYEEPPTYNLDIELLNDFISNEKHHTAKQQSDSLKRTKTTQNEPKKRHSDFDLPRNPRIMFRTATYESPKGTIVTSTDLENRRLSQLDQLQLRAMDEQNIVTAKPAISSKPSNIPVKLEKKPVVVSSKIPVFMSQKSLSSDNLTEKTFSLPRSPPPTFSGSSGNISVTSIIKSSSKHPSGKL